MDSRLPLRPDTRFLWAHPAHFIALGMGSGLSPKAAGTAGTVWAWVVFLVLQPWMSDAGWAMTLLLGLPLAWWASTRTARDLGNPDPGCIVIDEILAFWAVLWLICPAGWGTQCAAFLVFRFFDAVKPGPVAWADQLYHHLDPDTAVRGWIKAGWGILLDDFVAASCTLLTMALWQAIHLRNFPGA